MAVLPQSDALGVGHIRTAAVGVGQDGASVPPVRGVDGRSRNNDRPPGVADGFQVRKHRVERQIDDASNIFTKHPAGPELRNNSQHFRPEVTVISLASSLPGEGERLAGEAAGNNVNCS